MIGRRRHAAIASLLVALAAGWSPHPARAAGAHITPSVTLTPESIGLGQTTTLTITLETSGLSDVRFEPRFELENFDKISGASRAQKVSFVNGRVTRSDSLSWRLRPIQAGPARVYRIRVEVDTKVFVLDDVQIEIAEEPVPQPRQRSAGRSPFAELDEMWDPFGRRRAREPLPPFKPNIFMRAEVSPRSPFVGQQVLYTLYLFTQADVAAIDPVEMPDFAGAWSQEVPQPEPRKVTMTKVQDVDYGRVILLRKALFPLRDGRLEIEPVRARLVIKVPERSWLGPLLDRTEQIERTSNKLAVEVKPLPEAPEGFQGAVGQLELASHLEPAELEVGQAATLTVSLAGEGHIQGLPAPALPELDSVRRFPPEQSGRDKIVGTKVRGERSWTYVLVPDQPGEWELPEIRYPYFDPAAGEFKEAVAEAVKLRSLPDPETLAASAPTPATEEATEAGADLVAGSGLPRPSPWLWTLLALLPLLLAFLFKLRPSSQRRQDCRDLKRSLRQAAEIKSPRRSVDQIESSWREFLVRRWDLRPGVAPAKWGDLLEEKGANAETVEQIDRLAEDLNYLRFAPELAAADTVRTEILTRSARLLRTLG